MEFKLPENYLSEEERKRLGMMPLDEAVRLFPTGRLMPFESEKLNQAVQNGMVAEVKLVYPGDIVHQSNQVYKCVRVNDKGERIFINLKTMETITGIPNE